MERLAQSPTDPGFVQNPYPFYARARAAGDIVWWEEYGMAVAATHRAVSSLLRDTRLGREPLHPPPVPEHLRDFYALEAHSMLERDPPAHTRLRRSVLRAFTSRRIAALGPEIAALCDALMDGFSENPFDLLSAYAAPLPVTIIARLIGVPDETGPQLLAWSHAMVAMYQAGRSRTEEVAANDAARDFRALMAERIATARSDPRDDLITHLVHARSDGGDKLSEDEIASTCILLLNAGHEATVHALGNSVRRLLVAGARPDETGAAVEELLRLDPPLHLFTRWVGEDAILFGHRFAAGDRIGLLLASADRDGAVHDAPESYRPGRGGPQTLAFGAGPHFCLGAPLARLELGIALERLFVRCPNLRAAGDSRFAPIYHFHGLKTLPVALE